MFFIIFWFLWFCRICLMFLYLYWFIGLLFLFDFFFGFVLYKRRIIILVQYFSLIFLWFFDKDVIQKCSGEYLVLFSVFIILVLFLRSIKMFCILLCFDFFVVMFRVVFLFIFFLYNNLLVFFWFFSKSFRYFVYVLLLLEDLRQ